MLDNFPVWSIMPGAMKTALLRRQFLGDTTKLFAAVDPAAGAPTIVGAVRVMGLLMRRNTGLLDWIGGTAYESIAENVAGLAASAEVSTIILYIDSPGGSVDGLAEAADAIKAAAKQKTVIAQVEGMAASAAYYLASQATEIRLGRMDMVGSIGTRLTLYDFSKMFETAGIRPVVIDTGEFKSTGEIGTEITPSQEAELQRVVDAYFADFRAAVKKGRGMTDKQVDNVADGRMFLADESIDLKLADKVSTMSETLAELGKRRAQAQSRRTKAAVPFHWAAAH